MREGQLIWVLQPHKRQQGPMSGGSSPQGFMVVCRDVFLVGLADETLRSEILRLSSLILLSGERRRKERHEDRFQSSQAFVYVLLQRRGTCASLRSCRS